MRRIAWILVWTMLLCGLVGCTETAQPVADGPETAETAEMPEAVEAPETQEDAAPEPDAQPEQPVESEPEPVSEPEILWDVQPVYVYHGDDHAVAVDPAGQVVLELEDGELSLLRDSFTGEVRGIVARGTDSCRLYDCRGQLLAQGITGMNFGCTDRIFWNWTGYLDGCTIQSLTTGEVLWENLKSVSVLGPYLYAEQVYWNDPALLLNQDGTLFKELERGFSRVAVVQTEGQDYLIVEARDGSQGLLDQEGNSCLDSFYDRVTGVSRGCALVKAGDEYGAIDLETGETVFRSKEPLAGLLPEGAILGSTEGPAYQVVDRDGNPLYPKELDQLQVWEEDGKPAFLLGVETDQSGVTWVVFLELDGTERLRVEVGLGGLTMLSSRRAVYATNRETNDGLNRVYELVDLTTGETTRLPRTYCGVSGSELDGETYLTAYYRDGDRVLYDVLSWDGQPLFTGLEDCTNLGCGVLQCRQGEKQGLLCLDGTWLYAMDN